MARSDLDAKRPLLAGFPGVMRLDGPFPAGLRPSAFGPGEGPPGAVEKAVMSITTSIDVDC